MPHGVFFFALNTPSIMKDYKEVIKHEKEKMHNICCNKCYYSGFSICNKEKMEVIASNNYSKLEVVMASLFFAKKTPSIMRKKGEINYMILFMILTFILLILLTVVVLTTSVVGAGAIIIFGDVIVCIIILGWLIKKIFFKKKKK